jgi:N-acyl-D-amino-acid deacylase
VFDLVISGGEVIDGTGRSRFRADVAMTDGRVVAIDNLPDAPAREVIDATGKIVAPGLIDVHNHSDGWMLRSPHQLHKTAQGFTTEVLMADGISYAPVDSHTAPEWFAYLRSLDALRFDEYTGWQTLDEYMGLLDGRNVQHAAFHVPYANVRTLACGFGKRRVDDFQMRQIRYEIRKGMDAGAVGVSTGLDYLDQWYANTDELAAAVSVLKETGGIYVTHIRYKLGLFPALREAVEICRRAEVPLHISHLKPLGDIEPEEVLEFIDNEARKQVDVTFDVYPYQPGSTMLNFLLPYDVYDKGATAALHYLVQPEFRARFERALGCQRLSVDRIKIAWTLSRDNAVHQGKTLAQFADDVGKPPGEAMLDLLLEERLSVLLVFLEGDDRKVFPILQHPCCLLGSDAIYYPDSSVHPRAFGSGPRWLGHCVRDLKLFTLEDGVRRASALSAERFGLKDLGVLKPGAIADAIVFDAATIADRATFAEPLQLPVGIDAVITAGRVIVRDNKPVEMGRENLPGRIIRAEFGGAR